MSGRAVTSSTSLRFTLIPAGGLDLGTGADAPNRQGEGAGAVEGRRRQARGGEEGVAESLSQNL